MFQCRGKEDLFTRWPYFNSDNLWVVKIDIHCFFSKKAGPYRTDFVKTSSLEHIINGIFVLYVLCFIQRIDLEIGLFVVSCISVTCQMYLAMLIKYWNIMSFLRLHAQLDNKCAHTNCMCVDKPRHFIWLIMRYIFHLVPWDHISIKHIRLPFIVIIREKYDKDKYVPHEVKIHVHLPYVCYIYLSFTDPEISLFKENSGNIFISGKATTATFELIVGNAATGVSNDILAVSGGDANYAFDVFLSDKNVKSVAGKTC